MKVLVIEDNESFSLMFCAALHEAGHEVVAALMPGAFKKLPNCRGTMIKNQPMADILAAVAAALL